VGHRAGLEAAIKGKIPSPCRDSNPSIIKTVAQRYTAELSQLQNILKRKDDDHYMLLS
jgi:hypothetical protein